MIKSVLNTIITIYSAAASQMALYCDLFGLLESNKLRHRMQAMVRMRVDREWEIHRSKLGAIMLSI